MKNNDTARSKGKEFLWVGLAAGALGSFVAWRRVTASGQPSILLQSGSESRTALITGASSGIGAAFARQLAPMGYNLILVARREDRLSSLASELGERYPINTEVLAADLTSPADIERVERRIAELERLGLLINNAGFGAPGQFVETDLATHLNMIHLHVIASVRLTRAALPGMIARDRGGIINVSSIAGLVPIPGSVTYSATKAYLNVFSEALQAELTGTGVKVQSLCPGFTHTGFHDTPEHKGFRRSRIPEAMWMSAEEVAAESLAALDRRRVVFVPGLKYRLVAMVARNTPRSLLPLLRSNRPPATDDDPVE